MGSTKHAPKQAQSKPSALFEDLMEGAQEMVAVEQGERDAARTYHYDGPVLVEIRENGRTVWSLDEIELPGEVVAAADEGGVDELRKALRQTQEGIADLLGVSVGTLRGWEQKRRNPPAAARRLMKVLARNPSAVHEASRD
jgi:putative transcriptional regulator